MEVEKVSHRPSSRRKGHIFADHRLAKVSAQVSCDSLAHRIEDGCAGRRHHTRDEDDA